MGRTFYDVVLLLAKLAAERPDAPIADQAIDQIAELIGSREAVRGQQTDFNRAIADAEKMLREAGAI